MVEEKKKVKKCIYCRKQVLGNSNASGYCSKCYKHSPQYLEYQRIKQKEYYKEDPSYSIAYRNRPDVKAKNKKYMKKYREIPANAERIKELKANWARKEKEKRDVTNKRQ
jgi:hypothetical protein